MEKLERQKHEKLQWILSKAPEKRTAEELVDLAKLLMKNSFLKQFSTIPDFIEMCRYLSLELCTSKQIVFSQGDEGDNFYVILKGKVGVYISKALNKYKNFNYLKEIARLEAGQSFGELALLYNSVRAASIIALEPTELIVLNRDTFKKYIHRMQTSQLNDIVNFYEHLIFFIKMDKSEMIKLASKSLMKQYSSKTSLIKQNEEASCIFFIKRGLVQTTRRIRFKKNMINPHILTSFEDPNEEDLISGNFIELDLKIGEMAKGEYFADYEVINRKKMQYSVFTLLPTELIMLSEYDFKLQINEEVVHIWIKHMKIYPSDVELRKRYIETQYWSDFQKRVISNQSTLTNFHKSNETNRNLTVRKRNTELKRMEEEEEDHISLDNLLKDLERQTNFDEFLPYAENKKRELLPDDILPSPFSPVSDYKDKFFKKEIKRKLIIPIRSLPLKFEGKTTTCFSQYMNEIVREKIKFNRKKTKVDEIFNLQEKNLTVCKKNLKKILPKINKNISHTISGLLNSN